MTENEPAAGPERLPAAQDGTRVRGVDSSGSRIHGVTIAAAQLHVADLIEQDGALQRVTSLRLQGAPPRVSVALTGVAGRRSYAPDARVRVARGR